MGIFKRLFNIGKAEAHSAVDKLEDPIKMTEQGIRDLKGNLDESLKALAQVKAMAIRSKNEMETKKADAQSYEKKAIALLQRAKEGKIDPAEADRLASEALSKKDQSLQAAQTAQKQYNDLEQRISSLDSNIKKLKSNISHYENELRTLKARSKVSEATKNVNKQLSKIDSSGTTAMLERMKEKVEEQEALSDAYADIADDGQSLDEEIESALGGSTSSDALAALKAKLNTQDGNTPPAE